MSYPLDPELACREASISAIAHVRPDQCLTGLESVMKAKDVMTRNVITIAPHAPILAALQLMQQHNISGLPVVDEKRNLVGIVTEGDFLRRAETGTERQRSRLFEFLLGPGALAGDYVHTHGRRVDEIMRTGVCAVTEDVPLDVIVALMEKHRVKRIPVVRGGELVGIVGRANLLHALAGIIGEIKPGPTSDETIRDGVLAELDRKSWASRHLIDITVRNGIVDLWGSVFDARQRQAAKVAAENVAGVKSVNTHIVLIEPMSGMTFSDPDDDARETIPEVAAETRPADNQQAAVG
jgi:CBS domain-containing protein